MGFFVVDGAGHVEGGVESVVVVPGVYPVGDVSSGLGFGLVFSVCEAFQLQCGEGRIHWSSHTYE